MPLNGLPKGVSLSVTEDSGKVVIYKANINNTELTMMGSLIRGIYHVIVFDLSGARVDVPNMIKQ